METARNTVEKLNEFIQRLIHFTPGVGCPDTDQFVYDLRQGFTAAMDDDLNISAALAALFGFVKRVSAPLARHAFSEKDRDRILDTLKAVDSVIAVMDFEEERISSAGGRPHREAKRDAQDQALERGRRVPGWLLEMGVVLQDTPAGVTWKKK